jgi:hypothetical protein
MEGSGSLEDKLIEVQGLHWPGHHTLLPASALAPPRQPGGFGGVIWDVETAMEELGIKARQAANGLSTPGGSGNDENAALLRELLTQGNQEKILRQIEEGIMGEGITFPPYAGKAHSGAIVPGSRSQERTMIVKGKEGIFTEEQMAALGTPGQPIVQAPDVKVFVYGPAEVEVEIDEKKVEAIVERRERRQVRGARPRAGSQGRRIG